MNEGDVFMGVDGGNEEMGEDVEAGGIGFFEKKV